MSWDSGQVLDAVVLSKRCNVCKLKESTLDEHEFLDWYMAARGILQLKLLWLVTSDGSRKYLSSLCSFGRASWIRYTRVISEGDAKSVAWVNREQPYGSDVEMR